MTLDGEKKLGSSVESEVWELLDADDAVADETVYLVAAALQGDEELADQLGGDLPSPDASRHTVARRIGPPVAGVPSLDHGVGIPRHRPPPRHAGTQSLPGGITVISGRNGCGKSSFAEALEYALTGESYRFANRAKHWRDSWRNLHSGNPTAIEVDFAMEPDDDRSGSKVAIGADWAAGADLSECRRWSQIHGQKA